MTGSQAGTCGLFTDKTARSMCMLKNAKSKTVNV